MSEAKDREPRLFKGNIVRSRSGVCYEFDHYDNLISMWVLPLKKDGSVREHQRQRARCHVGKLAVIHARFV